MAAHSRFLPGESQGQRSLVGYSSPWGYKELDTTEHTLTHKVCQWVQGWQRDSPSSLNWNAMAGGQDTASDAAFMEPERRPELCLHTSWIFPLLIICTAKFIFLENWRLKKILLVNWNSKGQHKAWKFHTPPLHTPSHTYWLKNHRSKKI